MHYHPNPAPDGPAEPEPRSEPARGRYLAILNDDDRWLPGFLEAAVGVLERDPAVGIAFTDDYFEVRGRRVRRALPFAPGGHDHFLPELLAYSMPASAGVIRRDAWDEGERHVPISAHLVGDAVVWMRTASAGWPFHYIDEPLGISGVNASQVSWSDASLPSRMIATHDAFRFADPVCEALRRARMAEFLLARAHANLIRGRLRDVWGRGTRSQTLPPTPPQETPPPHTEGRPWGMRCVAGHPRLLVPMLDLWRRLRPPVLPT